mmetsp:Transcript_44791/g.113377  ORF Transcript_44791/g.113377 Transcript_44791/m.113377 type:complete len:361 (+) Transcript_44791:97-1179(+)
MSAMDAIQWHMRHFLDKSEAASRWPTSPEELEGLLEPITEEARQVVTSFRNLRLYRLKMVIFEDSHEDEEGAVARRSQDEADGRQPQQSSSDLSVKDKLKAERKLQARELALQFRHFNSRTEHTTGVFSGLMAAGRGFQRTFQAALRHNRHLRVFVDSSRDAISRTERTLIFGLSALALLGFNTFLYFILYEVCCATLMEELGCLGEKEVCVLRTTMNFNSPRGLPVTSTVVQEIPLAEAECSYLMTSFIPAGFTCNAFMNSASNMEILGYALLSAIVVLPIKVLLRLLLGSRQNTHATPWIAPGMLQSCFPHILFSGADDTKSVERLSPVEDLAAVAHGRLDGSTTAASQETPPIRNPL